MDDGAVTKVRHSTLNTQHSTFPTPRFENPKLPHQPHPASQTPPSTHPRRLQIHRRRRHGQRLIPQTHSPRRHHRAGREFVEIHRLERRERGQLGEWVGQRTGGERKGGERNREETLNHAIAKSPWPSDAWQTFSHAASPADRSVFNEVNQRRAFRARPVGVTDGRPAAYVLSVFAPTLLFLVPHFPVPARPKL